MSGDLPDGWRVEWQPWGMRDTLMRVFDDKDRHVKAYVRSSEGLCWEGLQSDLKSGRI